MSGPDPSAGREPGFELHGDRGDLRRLLVDLWGSRSLIWVLARKEFLVRYRRASFGLLWSVAVPLLQAVVLALVLPKLVDFQHAPGSYLAFVFAGTTAWAFFSSAVTAGTGAIVDGQDISTRVYFPRLVLPIVSVLANAIGLVPGIVVLLGVTVAAGDGGRHLVWLGAALIASVCFTTALCAVLSAVNVFFRDVRYLVQAALLAWFYVTPVIYPLAEVPRIRRWIEINPVTGIVQLFRAGTVGSDPGWHAPVAWAMGWTAVLAVAALWLHRRHDRVFVDLL